MMKGSLTRERGFAVGLVVSFAILLVEMRLVKPWPIFVDASFYVAMAKNPFAFITAQGYTEGALGHRILTPWIVQR